MKTEQQNTTKAMHTPGTWVIGKPWFGREENPTIRDDDGFIVAEVNQYAESFGDGKHLANATLIAAAPELLEACEYALRIFEAWKHDANPDGDLESGESMELDAAVVSCRLMGTAIAKAKGKEGA